MRSLSLWSIALVLAAVLAGGCRHPNEPGTTKPVRFFITPDTLITSVYQYGAVVFGSSDTTLHPTKYIWDIADGSNPLRTFAPTLQHSFYSEGVYSITCTAYDSINTVIGSASSIAIVQAPRASVTMTQHLYNITRDDTLGFKVVVSPVMQSLQYVWDFGDGTGPTYYYPGDSVSHRFESSGTYTVRVSVKYGSYDLGSDSAIVHADYPTTTLAELSAMDSVTAVFTGSNNFSVALPLHNGGEYFYTTTGQSFLAGFDHQFHSTGSVTIDTTRRWRIGGTLLGAGDYLRPASLYVLDSFYRVDNGVHTSHLSVIDAAPGRLRLLSKSRDSIVFNSRKELWGFNAYINSDTSFTPTPSGSGGCDIPGNVLTGLGGPVTTEHVTFIFHRRQ